MSPLHADELRRLEGAAAPAWLWDADRARIVWANRAGVRFWGEASLLDLLDRRFEPHAPVMQRIAALVAELESGAETHETLTFPAADGDRFVDALCRVRPLDDGRAGLLVVGGEAKDEAQDDDPRAKLFSTVLHAIASPVAVFDRHGSLIFANAACTDLFAETDASNESLLAQWLGDPDRASDLLDQVLRTGGLSDVHALHTRWGARAHRLTARRVAADLHGRTALVFMLDDIEDRQRLERTRERDAQALRDHLFAAADAIFTLDARGRLSDIAVIGTLGLARDPADVIGQMWLDAAAALGLTLDDGVRAGFRAMSEVRGAVASLVTGAGAQDVLVSAIPLTGESGQPTGMRGALVAASAAIARAPEQQAGDPSLKPVSPLPKGEDAETLAAIGKAVAAHTGDVRPTEADPEPLADAGSGTEAAEPDVPETDAESGGPLRVVGGREHADGRPAATDVADDADLDALARSPEPVLIHRAFEIVFANRAMSELVGRAADDTLLADANLLNLFPVERARLFNLQSRFDDGDVLHPGDVGMVPLQAALADGTLKTLMSRLERVRFKGHAAVLMRFEDPAGTAASTEMPAQPQPAAVATPSDAKALTEAQAQVSELSAILSSAADGIVTLDADGSIVTANPSAEAIFAKPATELAGTPLVSHLSEESGRDVGAYLQSVAEGSLSHLHREGREVEGRRGDGGTVPVYLTIGRMNIENGARFCAVLRDITEWKSAEKDLLQAKERAEASSTQKSDFLAKISHELRTPLNAIIGFSEVMSEEKFGPIANDRYKGYLADIRTSGEHLLSLINDLLDLSKIEAGKLELNFASVDLTAMIQQCITLMQPQATRERVIMRSSLPDQLAPVVADERSVRQILLNLLSNAIKYTPPGGQVILSVLMDDAGCLQIRIRDTGKGMSAEELKRAMEPFRQIETSGDTTEVAGTGLGLPLTKALTEANRAEFRIESTPQAGTLVQIIFPPERVLAS